MIHILKTVDVAKILGASLPATRNIMRSEGFPLIKVGKNLKVEEHALYEWMHGKRFYD